MLSLVLDGGLISDLYHISQVWLVVKIKSANYSESWKKFRCYRSLRYTRCFSAVQDIKWGWQVIQPCMPGWDYRLIGVRNERYDAIASKHFIKYSLYRYFPFWIWINSIIKSLSDGWSHWCFLCCPQSWRSAWNRKRFSRQIMHIGSVTNPVFVSGKAASHIPVRFPSWYGSIFLREKGFQ